MHLWLCKSPRSAKPQLPRSKGRGPPKSATETQYSIVLVREKTPPRPQPFPFCRSSCSRSMALCAPSFTTLFGVAGRELSYIHTATTPPYEWHSALHNLLLNRDNPLDQIDSRHLWRLPNSINQLINHLTRSLCTATHCVLLCGTQ